AVNILEPRGNAVAEAAHEVGKLTRAMSLTSRAARFVRSRLAVGLTVAVVAVGVLAWFARPWVGRVSGRASVRLPEGVRQRARAVAPLIDSGFVVATSNPGQLIRFSESGVQIGDPVDLMGEPVALTRTPQHLLVATRARDGIVVLEAKKLRVVDSTLLDPTL